MRTIVVYSTTADVPEHLRHLAYFRDGKDFLPIRFNASSEQAVRKIAETWWIEEAARQNKRRGGAFHKIAAGMSEALAVAKGEAEPHAVHVPDEFEDLLG